MPVTAQQARRLLSPLERNVLIVAAAVGSDPDVIHDALQSRVRTTAPDGTVTDQVRTGTAPPRTKIAAALRTGRAKLEAAARRAAERKPPPARVGEGKVSVLPSGALPRPEPQEVQMTTEPVAPADGGPATQEEVAAMASENGGPPPETFEERVLRESQAELGRLAAQIDALHEKRQRVMRVLAALSPEEVPPGPPTPPDEAAPEEPEEDPRPRVEVDLDDPAEEPEPEEPRDPDAERYDGWSDDLLMMPAGQRGGGNPDQLRAAAEAQLKIVRRAQADDTIVATEAADAAGVPTPRAADYLRAMEEARVVVRTGRNRRAAGQLAGRAGVEYRPGPQAPAREEGDDSPEREPTLEEVRDLVVNREGSFTVGEVAGELGAARAAVSAHFEWLEAREIVRQCVGSSTFLNEDEEVDVEAVYEYVAPTGRYQPRRKEVPPELEAARKAVGETGRERRKQVRHGARGWTGNKDVNKLLRRYRDEHHALVERTESKHIRVKFPNGGIVRVSSTPGPEALPWIEQDLEHAAAGRFDQIEQGGLGCGERGALGSAAERPEEVV